MKIILLASATAGHVLPLISISRQYQKRGIETVIVAEDKKVPRSLLTEISEASFIKPIINFKSYKEGLKRLSNYEKDCIFISMGGRVSTLLPALYFKGYRHLYAYELNAIMGRSNRFAQPFVQKMFSYFPLTGRKIAVIGHPLGDERKPNTILKSRQKILVLTGSNGSSDLFKIFDEMKHKHPTMDITISIGYQQYKFTSNIATVGFIDRKEYQNYDLILARSGAGTIADILRHYVPVMFLPSPNVKDDHQKKNAEHLKRLIGTTYLDYEEQKKDFYPQIQKEISYERRRNLVFRYDLFQSQNVFLNLFKVIADENTK